MNTILIKIIVPKQEDSWKVIIRKGRPTQKKNAVTVFRHVERFLSQKFLTFSTSEVVYTIYVLVDHSANLQEKPMTTISDGLYTGKNEALYWLASFLESYLPDRYLKTKYTLYGETRVMEGGGKNERNSL